AHEEEMAREGTPPLVRRPNLAPAGIVHVHWQPVHRFVVVDGNGHAWITPGLEFECRPFFWLTRVDSKICSMPFQLELAMCRRCHPVETALFNPVQLARGHPMSLVITHS